MGAELHSPVHRQAAKPLPKRHGCYPCLTVGETEAQKGSAGLPTVCLWGGSASAGRGRSLFGVETLQGLHVATRGQPVPQRRAPSSVLLHVACGARPTPGELPLLPVPVIPPAAPPR